MSEPVGVMGHGVDSHLSAIAVCTRLCCIARFFWFVAPHALNSIDTST